MKRTVFFIISILMVAGMSAQPNKSRVAKSKSATSKTSKTQIGNDRASLMFPTSVEKPEDVVWQRDLYKTLDLNLKENAALYYPVTPTDGRMNLFCTIFRLMNVGKLPAYEYKMDAIEHFDKASRIHFKDMLDRYYIPYEIDGNSIKIEDVDIPSGEVQSYYIKESSYYDQYTATYHSKVVAICPVLHRAADDFSMDLRTYPLFWVKYEDLEPYLNNTIVMTSDINNASTMSAADYFASNKYKGDIYMTTNMQNKSLSQLYPNDSDMVMAQKNIEKQMVDFEEHIWTTPEDTTKNDSIVESETKASKKSSKSKSSATETKTRGERRNKLKSSKSSKSSSSSSDSGSGARVSVRRQRH